MFPECWAPVPAPRAGDLMWLLREVALAMAARGGLVGASWHVRSHFAVAAAVQFDCQEDVDAFTLLLGRLHP